VDCFDVSALALSRSSPLGTERALKSNQFQPFSRTQATTCPLVVARISSALTLRWSPISTKGYKYKDKTAVNDGITKVIVKGGAAGKSKALVKGKGANLPDFDSNLPIAMGDLPLVVQLRNNASGVCLEGSFATPKKNQLDQFNAKNP